MRRVTFASPLVTSKHSTPGRGETRIGEPRSGEPDPGESTRTPLAVAAVNC